MRHRGRTGPLLLVLVLGACQPAAPPPSSAGLAPATNVATPGATASRLGEHPILSPTGDRVGTATVSTGGKTAASIDVLLSDSAGLHPWGIYDQAACVPPPVDHDAPFQFADIEHGAHSEEVEARAFLGFAGNLVLLVMSDGVGDLFGCADLGPPSIAGGPGPSPSACDESPAPTDSAGASDLAYSRDELSNADIYRSDDRGGAEVRLTTALGPDTKPSWSPSGDRIAFRSPRDGQDEIYVMHADGSCQRNLSNSPADDRSPAWSPNGCSIAFDHFFSANHQDIAVMRPEGGPMRRLTTRSGEYASWSPDGTHLAFASARDGDYDLYLIDVDGSNEHVIVDAPGYQMYPAWSPDGQWIAYETGPDSIDGLQVHVIRPDGTDGHAITDDKATNRFPAWAADGRLAWSASGTLTVLDSPGAKPRAIGPGQFPAWRTWAMGTPAC